VSQRTADVVVMERAADAPFLPAGAEHEMFDDQLAAPFEQVGEGFTAVRPVKHIRLVDPDPRQGADLSGQFVVLAGVCLLFQQQRLARCEPLVARYHLVVRH